jgi:hypothetical protein
MSKYRRILILSSIFCLVITGALVTIKKIQRDKAKEILVQKLYHYHSNPGFSKNNGERWARLKMDTYDTKNISDVDLYWILDEMKKRVGKEEKQLISLDFPLDGLKYKDLTPDQQHRTSETLEYVARHAVTYNGIVAGLFRMSEMETLGREQIFQEFAEKHSNPEIRTYAKECLKELAGNHKEKK